MKGMKFEKGLEGLEQIVEKLEAGELSLEESLAIFEKGVGLVRELNQQLDAIEKRLEVLTRDDSGTETLEDLDAGDPEELEDDGED